MNIKKIVTIIVLLFMPLSTYSIAHSGITLGDISIMFAMTLILADIIKSKKNLKTAFPLIVFASFLLLLSITQWATGIEQIQDGIMSILRYAFYIIFCAIVSRNYITFNFFYENYKKIGLLLAIYLILQFTSYYAFRFILPSNPLSAIGLQTTNEVYRYNVITRYTIDHILYRPCSLFVEPAHYVIFQAPLLYLLVNNKTKKRKQDIIEIIVIITSILLSGSTTGIIIILFSFIAYIISIAKKNPIFSLAAMLIIVCMGLLFINTNYGQQVTGRIFLDESYGAAEGRFGGVEQKYENIAIGNGMGYKTKRYLPSYPRMLITYGVIGIISLIMLLLFTYINCTATGKQLIILLLLTAIGTLSLFGISIVLYLPLIYLNYKQEENE